MGWERRLGSLTRYWRENGGYLLAKYLADEVRRRIVGLLLRSHLGSTVSIGKGFTIRGARNIQIARGFRAGRCLWIEAVLHYRDQDFTPLIEIMENVNVSDFVHIAATHYVKIGRGVLLGSKVFITDHQHGSFSGDSQTNPQVPPDARPLSEGCTILEDNVWVGDGAVILPGVTIGKGAVIGANAVVASDIPPYSIAAGVPARILKRYSFEEARWA